MKKVKFPDQIIATTEAHEDMYKLPLFSKIATPPETPVEFENMISSIFFELETNVVWLPRTCVPITKEVVISLIMLFRLALSENIPIVSLGAGEGVIEHMLTLWFDNANAERPQIVYCLDKYLDMCIRPPCPNIKLIQCDWAQEETDIFSLLPETFIVLANYLPNLDIHGQDTRPCTKFVNEISQRARYIFSIGGLSNDICGCDQWLPLGGNRELVHSSFSPIEYLRIEVYGPICV